jgi:hypothetical protein
LKLLDEGLTIDTNEWRLHSGRAYALTVLGRADEALDNRLRHFILTGMPVGDVAALRAAHARGGLPAYTRHEIVMMKRKLADGRVYPFGLASALAMAYGTLGDREALDWLERAADRREDGPLGLRAYLQFQFLRGDARYEALMRRVGFQ